MACILPWSSAVRVHDSKAYRMMNVTRERISRILELRDILLNLVNAAVDCVILESISGLELSSVITEPRYLKHLFIHFNLCVDATGVVCHQLGLFGTDLRSIGCGGFVEALS